MICARIEDLAGAAPRNRALIGLDLGTRTIGVAVSDRQWTVASPLGTIRRVKFMRDAAALADMAKGRDPGAVILGLPRNMDGSEGPRAQGATPCSANRWTR